MADEEEELEEERLREMVGKGVEVTGDGEEGSCGARVKDDMAEAMEGVESGGGGAGSVKEELREAVVEGGGLQDQVKLEIEAAGAGVRQEFELDEEAFSDDDLL